MTYYHPCPFCGGVSQTTVVGMRGTWVHCAECKAHGPTASGVNNHQGARDAWNRRAEKPHKVRGAK